MLLPPEDPEEFVSRNLSVIKAKFPIIDPTYSPLAVMTGQDFREYNIQLKQSYFPLMEHYLRTITIQADALARTLRLKFRVCNEGGAPANDVRVRLVFPDSVIVVEKLEPQPVPPSPPKKVTILGSPFILSEPGVTKLSMLKSLVRSNMSDLTIRDNQVLFDVQKIQHEECVVSSIVLLRFKQHEDVGGFTINYQMKADEVPLQEGRIQVKGQKE